MAKRTAHNPGRVRRLADAAAAGPVGTIYKQDHRSAVWDVEPGEDPDPQVYVVKRFEYAKAKQAVAWLATFHPAQRELRANRRLGRMGLPIVPIVAGGMLWRGLGGQAWLATPKRGEAVNNLLQACRLDADAQRGLMQQAAGLTARLLGFGLVFRDLKAGNLLLEGDQLWLIDVGAVKRARDPGKIVRMCHMFDHTCRWHGVPQATRTLYFDELRRLWPSLPRQSAMPDDSDGERGNGEGSS